MKTEVLSNVKTNGKVKEVESIYDVVGNELKRI